MGGSQGSVPTWIWLCWSQVCSQLERIPGLNSTGRRPGMGSVLPMAVTAQISISLELRDNSRSRERDEAAPGAPVLAGDTWHFPSRCHHVCASSSCSRSSGLLPWGLKSVVSTGMLEEKPAGFVPRGYFPSARRLVGRVDFPYDGANSSPLCLWLGASQALQGSMEAWKKCGSR